MLGSKFKEFKKLVKFKFIDMMIKFNGGVLFVFDNMDISLLFVYCKVVFVLKIGEYMIELVKIDNGYYVIYMIKYLVKGKYFFYISDLKD